MLIVGLNWPTFKWGLGARNWAIVVKLFIWTGKWLFKHQIPVCWPRFGGSSMCSVPGDCARGVLLWSCPILSQQVITRTPGCHQLPPASYNRVALMETPKGNLWFYDSMSLQVVTGTFELTSNTSAANGWPFLLDRRFSTSYKRGWWLEDICALYWD